MVLTGVGVATWWVEPLRGWAGPKQPSGLYGHCVGRVVGAGWAWPAEGAGPDPWPRPQHCTLELGSYIKDLSVVHNDLSSIVILDNSPGAYRSHPGTAPPVPRTPPQGPPQPLTPPPLPPDNAIPIKSWFSDPSDTALLNLLPMLDALR